MKSSTRHDSDKRSSFVLETLKQYERPLTRYAMRLLSGDLNAARDVVQHAFMKLCEQDWESLQDRVAPWLYTVCRNRSIDIMRGRNHEAGCQEFDDIQHSSNGRATTCDPARIVETEDFHQSLLRLIDELPESQREIIELWSQGFSSQEMGEITGKRAGAVRITLHRAIKQLRRHEVVRRWQGESGAEPLVPTSMATRMQEPR